MKTLIQDSISKKYYCVEQTMPDSKGGFTAGPNDFPFWSSDIDEAYDFGSELSAKNEMKFNDLACEGTRKPVIVHH